MDRVHFNSLDELNVLSYVCEKLSVKVTMPGTYRPDSLIHQVIPQLTVEAFVQATCGLSLHFIHQ